MASNHAVAIRRLYQDVWNGENPAVADELVHDDYLIHDRDLADQPRGADLYRKLAAGTREAFPDATFTIEDVFEADGKVAVRWTMTGTHEGDVHGIEPTMQEISMEAIEINRFEEGQLIETWTQADELKLMEQLGGIHRPE